MEEPTNWQLVVPAGVTRAETFKANPHPHTLEHKKVLLRWNGKPGGDALLKRIGENLVTRFKVEEVIKSWEIAPEMATLSFNPVTSREFARKLAECKPDIVIGSQCD